MPERSIGERHVSEVREDPAVAIAIEAVTGVPEQQVRERLGAAHGAKQIRNLFHDEWPSTAAALGRKTAALARDAGLHDEIEQLTGATRILISRRLNGASGKTLLKNLFHEIWPDDQDEAAASHGSIRSPTPITTTTAPENDVLANSVLGRADAPSDGIDGDGIEFEETAGESIMRPFDPNLIRVKLWTPTVDLVLKRLKADEIDVAPDFQRAAGIWKDKAQSQLVESLLIRIPLPAFYVDGSNEDRLVVVDGIQRLTALRRFVLDQELVLQGLEYLTDLEGKHFSDLARPFQRRIEETMLTIYLIDKGTPEEAKLNIFKRLNTGGEPLTSQEIRHAMNPGPARAFLRDLAATEPFQAATQGKFSDERMTDRECALRFCAFLLTPAEDYPPQGDFDAFLHGAMRRLNGAGAEERLGLAERFDRAMRAAHTILGDSAFRKPKRRQNRPPVNKALFEAWSVGFDRRSDDELGRLAARQEGLQQGFGRLIDESREFEQALSQGTGDTAKVKLRFSAIDKLLRTVAE